ncbi:pol polyprotein [Tanacetum coccineum]
MTNTQTPPTATTVVNTTGAPVTNAVANHAEKPEKFNGQNFKRWQQKMFFYLTTLGLARFLKETAPQVEPPAEGGEYVSPFVELCAKHGIRHEFTAPNSLQQNSIAEKKNRTLKEMVNAMLISSGLS